MEKAIPFRLALPNETPKIKGDFEKERQGYENV